MFRRHVTARLPAQIHSRNGEPPPHESFPFLDYVVETYAQQVAADLHEPVEVRLEFRKSPVVWGRGTFPYSGRITSVTYTPGDLAPDSPVALLDVLRQMGRRFE